MTTRSNNYKLRGHRSISVVVELLQIILKIALKFFHSFLPSASGSDEEDDDDDDDDEEESSSQSEGEEEEEEEEGVSVSGSGRSEQSTGKTVYYSVTVTGSVLQHHKFNNGFLLFRGCE